jgi:hypothetical protein
MRPRINIINNEPIKMPTTRLTGINEDDGVIAFTVIDELVLVIKTTDVFLAVNVGSVIEIVCIVMAPK